MVTPIKLARIVALRTKLLDWTKLDAPDLLKPMRATEIVAVKLIGTSRERTESHSLGR
jgi:hypothetical protein